MPGGRGRVARGLALALLLGGLTGRGALAAGPPEAPVPPPPYPPPPAPASLAPASPIEVVGTVHDASTGRPVSGARVVLGVSGTDPAGHEALTGSDGRFRFAAVEDGPWALRVEVFGFQPLQAPVVIHGAPPFEIRVRLVPEALLLEPVVVTAARSARLQSVGFYDRRLRGGGHFLDRGMLEARPALARLTDHLVRFPGVSATPVGIGTTSRIGLRGGCAPDIILDGMNLGSDVALDDLVSPESVEAVEVHPVATLPVQLSRSTCGAVVLWTRDPGPVPGARPFSFRRAAVALLLTLAALAALR